MWNPFRRKPRWGCLPYEKPHTWKPWGKAERSGLYDYQYRACEVCNLIQRRTV